jgi:putative phosphoserine phosphatase/1-acylglycerol-3-phosphate O-acyltransferase
MSVYAELTREIDESPRGPEIAALFDLDRTLIAGFSASAFLRDGLRNGRYDTSGLFELGMAAASFQLGTIGFSGFMTGTARTLRGMPEREFAEIGQHLFAESLALQIFPEARAIVEAHRRRGHTLSVVSSATPYQVAPIAHELGIERVLATRLEVDGDGRLTGEVERPPCYGEGKAIAARKLAGEVGLDLRRATSTPTATRTCRSSRRSATRAPRILRGSSAGSPPGAAGRSCTSPAAAPRRSPRSRGPASPLEAWFHPSCSASPRPI